MAQNEQRIEDLTRGNHDGLEEFYDESFPANGFNMAHEESHVLPTALKYVAGGLIFAGLIYGAFSRGPILAKSTGYNIREL